MQSEIKIQKSQITSKDLKERTKQFSIDIVKMVSSLTHNATAQILGNQILRSGTSVGANYRAVCRAKSKKDFINKLAIVIEEADETQYWLELLVSSDLIKRENAAKLWKEADELIRIMTSASKTTKSNIHKS
jgi:four helix bundle protein